MMLIKIGGGEHIDLEATITDLATQAQPCIIVHGANVLRDELATKLGYEKTILTSQSGYSSVFSDDTALEVIMMSYSGLRNKQIVELCQRHGINAVGLKTNSNGQVMHVRNRPIPGLYAAGNSAALLDTGAGYQSGLSNLRGMVWGWIGAKHAMEG